MAGLLVARKLFPTRISSVLCRRASSFFTDDYTPPQLDHVTRDWDKLYQQSIKDPETFWGQLGATRLNWMKPFDSVMDVDLDKGQHKWFLGGKLNVSGKFVVDHLCSFSLALQSCACLDNKDSFSLGARILRVEGVTTFHLMII